MNGTELSLINLPMLLIGSLLVAAMVTYLLRTWEWITAAGAAVFTLAWAAWLWGLDLSRPIREIPFIGRSVDLTAPLERFGFTLQLQPGAIPIVTTSLALAAVSFLLAARISQGHSFIPFSLTLLAGYVFLALVTSGPLAPPLVAPLFLIGLNCIGVFVLQAGRPIHPGGPLRMLLPPVLAFPLFLVAAWYIEQIPLNPQDTSAVLAAARLLGVGLLLLLAPVPLHSALPTTAQSAPPVVTALLTLLYQLALLHLLYRVFSSFPFVSQQTLLGTWLTLAGLVTAVWGGIAAAGASHPGRLWGYAALHDWGLIIMVLAVPGVRSWPLVLFLFSLRAISMFTAATGLSSLEQHTEGFQPDKVAGIGMRTPWNSAAYLLGALGLTGFPLSAGFTGHWAALQIIAETDWRLAATVLIASGGAILGFIRMARHLFGPAMEPQRLHERPMSALMALLVILISAGLALAPQVMDGPISRALVAFSG